ncbi:prolyl oligopeptidase family serine peptidase [Kribbella sp. NPDC059898]|uniref:prolyl oligopeptidase family serine peptidase n=1 Tax=Kribbella sp. NPDC059898 TaxID=3346995 RepID=UPI003660BDA3
MRLSTRLILALAAAAGQPIRVSGTAAPDPDPDSILLEPETSPQIRAGRPDQIHSGIRYDGKLRMDVLVPAGPGPHPLVLYLPGGGFVTARRQLARKQRRYVAAAGYVVASINYRTTSTGATYRDGLTDVATALAFLRQRAATYRLDPDHVAVWGESAGGYLAAMAATEPGNRLNAAVVLFGASDLADLGTGFDPAIRDFYTTAGTPIPSYVLGPDRAPADHPDEMRAADPANRVTPQTPPFLILHGDDDRIIQPAQTAHLHQALRSAGADSTRYVLRGAGHGDISDNPEVWTSVPLMNRITEFLHTNLR